MPSTKKAAAAVEHDERGRPVVEVKLDGVPAHGVVRGRRDGWTLRLDRGSWEHMLLMLVRVAATLATMIDRGELRDARRRKRTAPKGIGAAAAEWLPGTMSSGGARWREPERRAGYGGSAALVMASCAGLFLTSRGALPGERWDTSPAAPTQVMRPLAMDVTSRMPPQLAASLRLMAGLPMPAEPNPGQMKAPCVDSTGRHLRAISLRGGCWRVWANPNREDGNTNAKCPDWLYDPPPDAELPPVGLQVLRASCFDPIPDTRKPGQTVDGERGR